MATVALLTISPPESVLRGLLVGASGRLLASHGSSTQVPAQLEKTFGMYFEYALAAKMADQVRMHGDKDDVARIDYALRRAQLRILTPAQVPHDPPYDFPVLVSGFGYCDQINAAVAQVLSHLFRHAQLYTLYDPETHTSPHTVGRVWSDQRNEWLYFDAFPDRPIVFHHTGTGTFEALNASLVNQPERVQAHAAFYRLRGYVVSEYPSTYASFLLHKTMSANRDWSWIHSWWTSSSTATASPAPAASAEAATVPAVLVPAAPPAVDTTKLNEAVYAQVSQHYVLARAEDLVGDRQKAKEMYRAIENDSSVDLDDRAVILREAAHYFSMY